MGIEEILEPLGGPDNLEMMCEARNFVHWDSSVSFEVGTSMYRVTKTYSVLFFSECWRITVFNSGVKTHEDSDVINPGHLASLFKHYSGYSAFF